MTPPSFPMGLYSSDWTTQLLGMEKEESSNNNNINMNMNMTTSSSNTEEAVKCPRCSSSNTKFCYYNNYSLSQPRHFCKACKRYWTRGGTLRNVPVGGGCRKSKPRSKKSLTGMMTPTASHHHQLLNSHHMSSSSMTEFSQLTSRIGRLSSETLQALLFGKGNYNDDTHTNTNALLGFSGLEEGYGFMGGSVTSDSRSCLGYEQQLLNDYQPWSLRTYLNESPTETETETETLNVLGSLQALNAASSSCEGAFNDEWRKTETELDPCGYNNSWNETDCGYGDVLYPNKQDIYVSH